MLSSN
jgi:Tfp pilus assembly protein PilF